MNPYFYGCITALICKFIIYNIFNRLFTLISHLTGVGVILKAL